MLAFCTGLLLLSCTGQNYPPIIETPTYTYRHGDFVWHELATTDLAGSRNFYRELFHWEFEEFDVDGSNYLLVRNEGKYIAGMISVPESNKTTWLGAISVENTENAVDRAVRNGSDVLISSTLLPGRGSMALVRDPQGALTSFIHSNIGDPALEEVNSFEWLWTELWADKPKEAGNYYSAIFPYTVSETSVDGKPYWVLNKGMHKVGGIIQNPVENMNSMWVPYIKVVDPEFMAQKAKKLGATILLEPSEEIRNSSVAVLADPNGAIFCLQKWPLN